MGHLFSRAFKRLTQGGQSRNQQPEQQNNDREQQVTNNLGSNSGRPITESIPVGQSIDSADYAALDTSNTRTRITTTTTTTARKDSEENNAPVGGASEIGNNSNGIASEDDKQGVEREAVIKIQALVRGHLARKALKDAHHNSVPPPNALGQSQFDASSLLRDPPSAIFLQLTSNGTEETRVKQPVTPINGRIQASSGSESQRTSLDPIAEVPVESSSHTTSLAKSTKQPETSIEVNKNEEERKKLLLICSRSASSPSQLETPRAGSMNRDSSSPVPSEANASIDLNYDTPASASIDIMTSIIPTGNIASVLHHKQDDCNDRARELAEAAVAVADDDDYDDVARIEIGHPDEGELCSMRLTINENGVSGTPDSLESEEAAAIRIQSAFRGYRTRKNSPYRTRSPNSSASKRNALIQQEATILDENDERLATAARVTNDAELTLSVSDSAEVSELNESAPPSEERRRSSRIRQRDCSGFERPLDQRVPSADEFTMTEDDTTQTGTVRSVLSQQSGHNESAVADETVKSEENLAKEASIGVENEEPSFSLEVGESEPNTLDEPWLSSALETGQTTASVSTNSNDKVSEVENNSMPIAKPSFGSKSEASVETYDTESSVLGAALSLNEDLSVADLSRGSEIPTGQTTEQKTFAPALDTVDEGKSQTLSAQIDNSNSDVSKLRDEELQPSGAGALVEEEEEEMATNDGLIVLDEQEQRAIELESDDIERRDPRGQVSEKRTKSPQIRLDEPQFAISKGVTSEFGAEKQAEEGEKKETGGVGGNDNLSPGRGDESGRSTPALNSSVADSSSEDDSDQAQRDAPSPGGEEANKKQQQSVKNKKRNNRNKRKGKK